MRCLRFFLLFCAVFLCFLASVNAETYYVTSQYQYFHSVDKGASGYAYINFDSTILPLMFTTFYRDESQRFHFDNYWIKTNVSMTITAWFSNNWLNYTCSAGTQQFLVDKPNRVYFNGVEQTEGTTWSYSGGILTVSPSGTNVAVSWAGINMTLVIVVEVTVSTIVALVKGIIPTPLDWMGLLSPMYSGLLIASFGAMAGLLVVFVLAIKGNVDTKLFAVLLFLVPAMIFITLYIISLAEGGIFT